MINQKNNINATQTVGKSLKRQPSQRSLVDQLNHNCIIHDIGLSGKYGLIITLLKMSTGALINIDIQSEDANHITLSTGRGTPRHEVSCSTLRALRPTVRDIILCVLGSVDLKHDATKEGEWWWQERQELLLLKALVSSYRDKNKDPDNGVWDEYYNRGCSPSFRKAVDDYIIKSKIEKPEN